MFKDKKRVAITMGDPAGIGPEIICKALLDPEIYEACDPIVIGTSEALYMAAKSIGISLAIHAVRTPAEGVYKIGTMDLIDLPQSYTVEPGVLSAENGQAAIDYMKHAYELVVNGQAHAIANAPSNKEAMHLAGSPYTGATELFAALGGVNKASTIIRQGKYYVFQTTSHVSLRDALEAITKERIDEIIAHSYSTMREFGVADPVIAISGINPHCGENGLMGKEEIEILNPAIIAAQERGIRILDPIPADVIFIKAASGIYDAVIGMFHDTTGAVNKYAASTIPTAVISGGLPFVRTTVAHGTAFDIAYQNKADHLQLKTAILTAAEIASAQ